MGSAVLMDLLNRDIIADFFLPAFVYTILTKLFMQYRRACQCA